MPEDDRPIVQALQGTELRAAYSTGFRAPSLFQQNATQTVLEGLFDTPMGATGQTFRAVRNFGNPDLKNEESESISAGITLKPLDGLSISTDFWRFDYEDIVVKNPPQAILDSIAAMQLADPGLTEQEACDAIQGCREVIRDAGTGQILRMETEFFNAATLETLGLDFGIQYAFNPQEWLDTGIDTGLFTLSWEATYILDYKIQEVSGSPKIDVVDRRNFRNFGSSVPELRWNLGLVWSWQQHTLANFVRYIDQYKDDEDLDGDGFANTIDEWVTWDIIYSFRLEDVVGTSTTLFVSLINALDEDPPGVLTNGGYDTKVHDPRGRLFSVGLAQVF
jgi:outer membrane receptor protein involved in Fe transport